MTNETDEQMGNAFEGAKLACLLTFALVIAGLALFLK